MRAQSSVDFLVTYGWALLLIAIVLALLYSYITLPANIVPGSCNFYGSISCSDIQLSAHALTLYVLNSQSFPMNGPSLYVSIGGQNSVTSSCVPNFVLPGGEMASTVNSLPITTTLSSLYSGYLYLSAGYCGLANNYATTGNCVSAPSLTYSGSFSAHSEPQTNPIPYAANYVIYVTVKNASQSHGTMKDPFYAQVMMGNFPVVGATLSFTSNNPAFYLQTSATITNVTGNSLSYIWGGGGPVNVMITATLGSTGGTPSNTANIVFT